MEYLVGGTGFVGTNLRNTHIFDGIFHSSDVEQAYGMEPELLVYAGVPAEMFLANHASEKDREVIEQAIENIRRISAKKVVLISTVAVYRNAFDVDEDTEINEDNLSAYGKNRLILEKWVEENVKDYLIVRLPGLYGINLKKNFIYDFIHRIPAMLSEAKYQELSMKNSMLCQYYHLQENGFYKCYITEAEEKRQLKKIFDELGFCALNFTDSRGIYQYYNLKELWKNIEVALANGIRKLNLAVEPVTAGELYKELTGTEFENQLSKPIPHFDIHSRYAELFGGRDGYLHDRNYVLTDLKRYIWNEWKKEWGEDAVINF